MNDKEMREAILSGNFQMTGKFLEKAQEWMVEDDEYRQYMLDKLVLDPNTPEFLLKMKENNPKQFLRFMFKVGNGMMKKEQNKNEDQNPSENQ